MEKQRAESLLCGEQDYSQWLSSQNWAALQNTAVHWVTYRENDVDSIYFNSSCRKWFKSWTICLLHWCIDGLLWRRNGIEGWKIEGIFLKSWLIMELLVDKTYEWESEFVICSQKQAVHRYLILKYNLSLQYTPCVLTLIQISLWYSHKTKA